jgi:hypothetical protein
MLRNVSKWYRWKIILSHVFIKLKLKNLEEDFGNPEISSETYNEPKTPVEPKMNERTGRISELAKNLEKSLFVKK